MKETQKRQWSAPRCLPVVNLHGTDHFVDERLRQFREVTNPHHNIEFDSETGKQMLREFYVVKCSVCALETGIARNVPRKIVTCRRCKAKLPVQTGIGVSQQKNEKK